MIRGRGAKGTGCVGGEGESEGFMLPYVVGGVAGESLEDLEVQRLEL